MKLESRLKLLVLCQLFYPELISTGQTLTELCEELAGMGVKIEVLCGPPTLVDQKGKIEKTINYKGITINRVFSTRFPKLNLFGRISNQVTYALSTFRRLIFDRSQRPILVVTNPPFLAFFCALLGRKFIYLIHDVYPDTAVKLGLIKPNGLLARIWDRLNAFTYSRAARIIVIGRCMQEIIQRNVPSQKNKVKMIHVWSNDKLIGQAAGKNNPFIERWGLKDKFVVGYSGNMGWFHDMETIMQAADQLQAQKDLVFLFIGEGHKKRWMIDYTQKRGMTNCQFHSYVKREELGLALACSQLGLASLLSEQVGLSVPSKIFGFMAAGVPIIGVLPSSSEAALVISEEKCGLVVRPGDAAGLAAAILRLKGDPEARAVMAKNARQAIAQKYSLHWAAAAYYAIISDLNEDS